MSDKHRGFLSIPEGAFSGQATSLPTRRHPCMAGCPQKGGSGQIPIYHLVLCDKNRESGSVVSLLLGPERVFV